ncbi:MAG: hypothetical protein MK074_04850 [Phycisphaerales bacterium]|nr:hypothetical protein [Phycisphaerales bacterium]
MSIRMSAIIGAAVFTASASASTWIAEDVPAWRGAEGSAYYLWDDFTSASAADGPNMPNNEMWPSGDAMLFNFSDGAFISGEGNIYGFGGPLNVHTYIYTQADAQALTINIATLGSEIDYGSMFLAWTDGTEGGAEGMAFAGPSINYWEEVDFGQGTGALVNVSYTWDLSGIDADVRELGLIFQGSGAHMSLDMVSVDVLTAVPAPGAFALLGLAGAATRRRRR